MTEAILISRHKAIITAQSMLVNISGISLHIPVTKDTRLTPDFETYKLRLHQISCWIVEGLIALYLWSGLREIESFKRSDNYTEILYVKIVQSWWSIWDNNLMYDNYNSDMFLRRRFQVYQFYDS